MERVARVPGIALPDLYHGEARRRRALVIPHAEHVRDPACVQRPPDLCGAADPLQEPGLVDGLVLRRAAQDGVVAVEDRLDVDVGARLRVVRVVAHPFSERTLGPNLAGDRLAFYRDFAVGRDRKAGVRPADDVDRLAAYAAGDVELADLGDGNSGEHEKQRVLPAENDDLHRLAAREVLVAVDAAVLALGDLAADRPAVVDLRAVRAKVEPARVRVLRDHAVGRADEARRVGLVVARHGKSEHVAGVTFEHVLQDRPVLDDPRRDRFHLARALVIRLDDVDLALVPERQPERERDAPDRGEMPVERAEALRVAGHVVEEEGGGPAGGAAVAHVHHGPHLPVPVHSPHALELPERVGGLQPFPEVTIGDGRGAALRGDRRHVPSSIPGSRPSMV